MYLADRIIVFHGTPGEKCEADSPCSVNDGMNKFLKDLDITFRRDKNNYRPRVNKPDSAKDKD